MKTRNFKPIHRAFSCILGSFALLISCEKDTNQIEAVLQYNDLLENNTELAYPQRSGELININLNGQNATVEKIDDQYVFEGDILLSEDDLKTATKSTGRLSKYWSNCTVYYTIESSLPNKRRVHDAINHWRQNSSFRFIKRTNQKNYINFRKGSGCSSEVGCQGGKQHINLADGCNLGSTIHEIGHAIGLWHEQSRKDRNNYININWKNIQSGKKHNFETYTQRGKDGAEFSPFDFNSIMMYGPNAFSKGSNLPTITKKDGSSYSVNRTQLSYWDKVGLKHRYSHICGYDFEQRITGPRSSLAGDRVTYKTSENQRGNSYKWEVNYAGVRGWRTIPNGTRSSVTFRIGSEAIVRGIDQMSVRCTVIKSNGDVSRKNISTTVEGKPTGTGGGGGPLHQL